MCAAIHRSCRCRQRSCPWTQTKTSNANGLYWGGRGGGWVSADQPSPRPLTTYQIGRWSTSPLTCVVGNKDLQGDSPVPKAAPSSSKANWSLMAPQSWDVCWHPTSTARRGDSFVQQWDRNGLWCWETKETADWWLVTDVIMQPKDVTDAPGGRFGLKCTNFRGTCPLQQDLGENECWEHEYNGGVVESNKSFCVFLKYRTYTWHVYLPVKTDLPEWRTESWITLQRNCGRSFYGIIKHPQKNIQMWLIDE